MQLMAQSGERNCWYTSNTENPHPFPDHRRAFARMVLLLIGLFVSSFVSFPAFNFTSCAGQGCSVLRNSAHGGVQAHSPAVAELLRQKRGG